jgi:hypothetical protein
LRLKEKTIPAASQPPLLGSRLYFSQQINGRFARNWNGTARIGEKNWYAFSWKVELPAPTLSQLLLAHLTGFAKEK